MLSSQILCKSYQIWKIQVFCAANTMSMGESFLASQTIIVHLKCVVSTCQTTYSHVPQHLTLQQHHCEEAQISPLNVVWRQSSSQMWCHATWNMVLAIRETCYLSSSLQMMMMMMMEAAYSSESWDTYQAAWHHISGNGLSTVISTRSLSKWRI